MIHLSNGFSIIAEGEHTFRIDKVVYDEDFGKMEVSMTIENGQKHTERYNLLSANGEPNEKALNAFSFAAKVAMNDFTLEDINEQDLVGKFFKGTVTHDVKPSTKDPKKNVTFVQISNRVPANGFPESKTKSSLAALLDD